MSSTRMVGQVGRVLGGRYRLLAPVGAGASAQVFLADDIHLRRRVAVKLLHPALANDPAFLKRFRAEAQAAAALSHPNILAVHDWGEEADDSGHGPYLVLEYLGGGSLRSLLDAGHLLTPSQALVVGLEAARGLEYAHRRGLVHRDVKPANLCFDEDGRLRIADFGLARAIAEAAWTEPQGVVLGTARYASPEQAKGQPVDGRSDVYSLALVLVEALSGHVPFSADSTVATLMARVDQPLPVPEEAGPLRPILERAGAPDPADRYDASALARALVGAAEHLPRPAPLPLTRLDPLATLHDDATMLPPVGSAAARTTAAPGRTLTPDDPTIAGPPAAGDITVLGPAKPPRRRRLLKRLAIGVFALAVLAGAALGGYVLLREDVPSYPVPALVGRSEEEAFRAVGEFGWQISTRTTRVDGTVPGEVVEQIPAAGVELEEGEPLVLTISEGPTLTPVPDLANTPQPDAEARLAEAGLVVGAVNPVHHEEVPAGIVLEWSHPGEQLPKGSAIDLTVSAGPAPRTVGDLRGRTFDDAAAELAGQGLRAERVDQFSDDVAAGHVISTDPGAGATVERGATVRVVVSRGPDLVTVPDVDNTSSVAEAVQLLQAAGLNAGDVQGPALGRPYVTDPGAGTQVRRGTTVDIYLRR